MHRNDTAGYDETLVGLRKKQRERLYGLRRLITTNFVLGEIDAPPVGAALLERRWREYVEASIQGWHEDLIRKVVDNRLAAELQGHLTKLRFVDKFDETPFGQRLRIEVGDKLRSAQAPDLDTAARSDLEAILIAHEIGERFAVATDGVAPPTEA